MKYYLYYFILFLFIASDSIAQEKDTLRTFTATRVENAPKIDGIINEEVWTHSQVTGDFIQRTPIEGKPESYKTEVRIIYTDFAVYIAATMYDPHPDSILKQLGKRDDQNLNADYFYFKIDTYNKHQDAYQFGVYASGVQMDSKFSDATFDAVWKSAVVITDKGWNVEMEIPYSAFRFPKKNIQDWSLQFNRYIRRTREFDMWAFAPNTATNAQLYWGHLAGITDVKTPLRLSLTPYLSAGIEKSPDFNNDGTYSYSKTANYSAGADIKYGIDDRFTLDMTLFPDFGQVQSDKKIKNLSYRETVYDENRPFFKEGVELFNKGNLFYSRRIGKTPTGYYSVFDNLQSGETVDKNPTQVKLLNATKISGRTDNGLGIGFFNAATDNTYATIKNEQNTTHKVLTEPLTNYNILVLDQQLKNNSDIYIINANTTRTKNGNNANVTGAGISLSNKKNNFQFNASGSRSSILEKSDLENGITQNTTDGYKYNFGAEKVGGNFTYGAYRTVRDYNYTPTDLGYYEIPGQVRDDYFLNFSQYKPWKFIRESYDHLTYSKSVDFKTGKISNNELDLNLFANLLSYNAIFCGGGVQPNRPYDYHEARQDGRVYHGLRYFFLFGGFSTDYRKTVAVDYNFNMSNFIDQYLQEGYNNSISFRIRPNDKSFFIYSFEYDFDPYNVGYATVTDSNDIIFGGRKLNTFINELDATYIFKNNMSLSLIGRHYWFTGYYKKYFLLEQNGELNGNTSYSENNNFNYNVFTVDFVFEWRFSPGSLLDIIYKNDIENQTSDITNDYYKNFGRLLNQPQTNSLNIKVLYYLDYLKVHGKIAKQNHKSNS